MLTETVLAIVSGGFVGFILGLLGGGGSILATPLLLYAVGTEPHVAIGTGAFAVSVNAYLNLFNHARKGHIWWKCAGFFAVFGCLGALAGSTIGKSIDSSKLLFLFGLMMMVVGALMLRSGKRVVNHMRHESVQTHSKTLAIGFLTGLTSGFFGIGGGFLIVPGLILATGMPTISAVGSSLLAVGTFGLTTALNYAASGLVDWWIASEFIVGGIAGGIGGMIASTSLSNGKDVLHRYFAALVFLVAIYILYRSGSELLTAA
ncbi:protein of unknown function DUF81 [Rhizobium sp. CF080]|nr:protein of unknown function DUF81 [Rhizobium sp. CF080]